MEPWALSVGVAEPCTTEKEPLPCHQQALEGQGVLSLFTTAGPWLPLRGGPS